MYLLGSNNYTTHDEARREFYRCQSPVALELCKDGSAFIAFLQGRPLYAGQPEYRGTQPVFNSAAEALR